ncbi:hypothetical protein N7537_005564 [Penicillium hordei]|uniref:Uncharacterized protein n=1 Tax=Penicillium hordei TaxID=40994 RepID=A0AAD6E5Z3_9EURO|nr:uncharacterized protein N7537_005564 [Penicillium hordei]KAJ5602608.1 hypothetical protein N7537_005564 [Penicillium hordei]
MIDLQARPLRGFEVMIGEGGVRAILPLFDTINNWIGKPVDGLYLYGSVRISTDNEILGLSADFDVLRTGAFHARALSKSLLPTLQGYHGQC